MMAKLSFLLLSCFLIISCGPAEKQEQVDVVPEMSDEFSQARQIMMKSAKTLQSRVKWALEEKGMIKAVNYCNVEGNLLLDSLSKSYNASIGRVSHKPRSVENTANKMELALIQQYQENLGKGERLQPKKVSSYRTDIFYFPIMIQSEMCLRCHGTRGEDFSVQEYISIQLQYPGDQATGFKIGDLRGLWKIQLQQAVAGL